MKNILFISDNDGVPWGGSEELWSQTALQLSKNHKVSVLVERWSPEPMPITLLKNSGIKVFYKTAKNREKPSVLLSFLYRIFGHLNKTKRHPLLSVKSLESFDLIIISMCDSVNRKLVGYTEILQSRCLDYVLLIQLATDLRPITDKLSNSLKVAYECAKRVYFLSPENAVKTQMLLGCQLENIDYVNNPFNYQQTYFPFKDRKDTWILACVANLKCFHKGQDLLLMVLSQEKWKQRNWHLNFYGTGINKQLIERLISLYQLEDKVSLVGYEPDKTKIWDKNMACVLPSRMEGQSLAMLEAMSFGRLVISTKVGDAERLIEHGKTGFLIDYPTIEAIDKTLDEAWEARTEWLEMGKLSRVRLYEKMPKDPIVLFIEKLLSLFEE